MAVFQFKNIVFQEQFSILSAFSIENSRTNWHLYCNSLTVNMYRDHHSAEPRRHVIEQRGGLREDGVTPGRATAAQQLMWLQLNVDIPVHDRHLPRYLCRVVIDPAWVGLQTQRRDRLRWGDLCSRCVGGSRAAEGAWTYAFKSSFLSTNSIVLSTNSTFSIRKHPHARSRQPAIRERSINRRHVDTMRSERDLSIAGM